MGMQKYRADESIAQADGATQWLARWMGGPTLSKIENCRLVTLQGDMRRTVYITGDAGTWFSIPACCKIAGTRVTGYVTSDKDDGAQLVFRHTYY